jgi:hypothetical protein
VTILDPGNVGYQKLELWDSTGTAAGGRFVIGGVAQTGGHEIDITSGNVAALSQVPSGLVFDAGTASGTDMLWAQLLETDGSVTGWQPFSVTVPAPSLAVHSVDQARPGQIINLSTLVGISDPGSVGYQKLELWDSNGTSAGGHFVINGSAQTGGHEIDVSPGWPRCSNPPTSTTACWAFRPGR